MSRPQFHYYIFEMYLKIAVHLQGLTTSKRPDSEPCCVCPCRRYHGAPCDPFCPFYAFYLSCLLFPSSFSISWTSCSFYPAKVTSLAHTHTHTHTHTQTNTHTHTHTPHLGLISAPFCACRVCAARSWRSST